MTTPPTPDAGVKECEVCGGSYGYINAETDAHDDVYECVRALTAQLAAAKADNEVLHHEVQMQLMELGMKAIGDHNRQFFRDDDDDAARTGAR